MKTKSTSKDLYVAEIAFDAEEEDLRKLFSLCGTVRAIHMITDQKTGQFKGCAFVHMANAAEARDAINTLDGTYLLKRCINVTAALPRKPAPSAARLDTDKPQPAGRPRRRRK
jgi:RNA recognition motif-containing protein